MNSKMKKSHTYKQQLKEIEFNQSPLSSIADPDPPWSTTFDRIRIRFDLDPRSGSGSGSTSIYFPGSGSTEESIDLEPGNTKTNQNYVG